MENEKYNGYRSWAEWNRYFWLNNDDYYNSLPSRVSRARSNEILQRLVGTKTPDGVKFTKKSIDDFLAKLYE